MPDVKRSIPVFLGFLTSKMTESKTRERRSEYPFGYFDRLQIKTEKRRNKVGMVSLDKAVVPAF